MGPDVGNLLDACAEVVAMAGQRRGIDRAGRGAANNIERIALGRHAGRRQNAGDRLQYPDLVGGAGPAASQDQSGFF